jgi:RNA polymerase II subunit A small phosphatase-like protein
MEPAFLILDLDETLLWATKELPEAEFDFQVFGYFATKRPHLEVFLESIFTWFDVAVWTSSGEDYARQVIAEIFDDPAALKFVWSASRCTQRFDAKTGEPFSLKDLKKVRRKGYVLDRVLMIDDSPEKLGRNYGNHLQLRPFEGNPNDSEFLNVLPFLGWIKDQPNFRVIEKRTWRNRRFG